MQIKDEPREGGASREEQLRRVCAHEARRCQVHHLAWLLRARRSERAAGQARKLRVVHASAVGAQLGQLALQRTHVVGRDETDAASGRLRPVTHRGGRIFPVKAVVEAANVAVVHPAPHSYVRAPEAIWAVPAQPADQPRRNSCHGLGEANVRGEDVAIIQGAPRAKDVEHRAKSKLLAVAARFDELREAAWVEPLLRLAAQHRLAASRPERPAVVASDKVAVAVVAEEAKAQRASRREERTAVA